MIKDEYTRYDYTFHRYYLTQAGLQALSGLDVSNKVLNISIDRWLMKVSDSLYDWVPVNRQYFAFLTATDEEAHNVLLKALCYQAEWCLNNGFIDEEAAINWDSTTKMDNSIYDRVVSPRCVNILTKSGLLYCGRLPYVPGYKEYETAESGEITPSDELMFNEE